LGFNVGDRVLTGIGSFDDLIGGGFPRGSFILLAGVPGAGKTIFSASFIYNGAVKFDEPGVYACFAEDRSTFIKNMRKLGMDFERLISIGRVDVLDLSIGNELDVQSILNMILNSMDALRAKRLVVDSITALLISLRNDVERRYLVRLLYKIVKRMNCTAIIIADKPWKQDILGSGALEFIADGIILMETYYDVNGHLRRRLQILKMRGTSHSLDSHEYVIDCKGIRFLPRIGGAHQYILEGDVVKRALSHLATRGWRYSAPARITGKSGLEHEFTIALWGPGKPASNGAPDIVVDVYISPTGDCLDEVPVLRMFTKEYDIRASCDGEIKKYIIAVPKMTDFAKSLSKQFNIEILEVDSVRKIESKLREIRL